MLSMSSSTSTLVSSSPPQKKNDLIREYPFTNHRVQASDVIEFIASSTQSSSCIYVYDVAEQVGFGTLTKEWARGDAGIAAVFDLQTRPGAGLTLVGRLSQGTSQDSDKGTVLTAYTTPTGLAYMAPSLVHAPPPSPNSRLIIQVPTITSIGERLAFSPTLAPLASIWPMLPNNIAVLLSSTPQQSVAFASLSYSISDSHVIHLFDHHSASRESVDSIKPPTQDENESNGPLSLHTAIKRAGYSFFEYHGDTSAHSVIVLLNGPIARTLKALLSNDSSIGLGIVVINVLRPWDDAALLDIIPPSVATVHVFDDVHTAVTQGNLYVDIFSALWNTIPKRGVHAHRLTPLQSQDLLSGADNLRRFIQNITQVQLPPSVREAGIKKFLLFSVPRSPLSALPRVLESLFATTKGISSRLLTDHDVFSKPGGITASRLLVSRPNANESSPVSTILPLTSDSTGSSDFLAILDQNLLKSHSLLKYAKPGSTVLVTTSWTAPEFRANVAGSLLSVIAEKGLKVYLLDVKGLAGQVAQGPTQVAVQNVLAQLAILRLYLGPSGTVDCLEQISQSSFGSSVQDVSWAKLAAQVCSDLTVVDVGGISLDGESSTLEEYEFNAIAIETSEGKTIVNGARLGSWYEAAKHLLFPSAYFPLKEDVNALRNSALRPEVPDTTFLVTCTVNKRLTPLEYDRNVFHLEFDTSGTGLTYAIGEALGVHGWNDEQEVLDFCSWYGIDPNRLITIPLPSDETQVHTRTVLQALQQQIDLFGRPPKSFYTDLAEYATTDVDRYALRFIGSPEGSSTFKKLSEKDTVTFADILQKYGSARPGIERLCELIGDIKPRHYSIASAQSVVGDRVDLLVVAVDWFTPTGSPRYGQCTRYLSGLKVGQKVTVSIKPSVMKLPPNPKQPLIMAGLGTGAAPFRAFLQHLGWLAQRGEEVGPVYYYFGSRHQSAEYLYGEEIEAFVLDNVITRAGLAFSRDGPKKVYIQHKMLEDSQALAKMLRDDDGVFYLCGPTWPVPDVYEALVNALVKYNGMEPTEAGDYLESLKEEERYVLEVY